MTAPTLDAFLASHAGEANGLQAAVCETVRQLAQAARKIHSTISCGTLGTSLAGLNGRANADGDYQRNLDIHANEVFLEAMRSAPVALYGSEESHSPLVLDGEAALAVAIDPLDGSSNIDTNVSIGTIFSILPVAGDVAQAPERTFLQPGSTQLAAGFFIYGPQLAFAFTCGSGTHIFVYSTRLGTFVQAHESRAIPPKTQEFAINASNYRHWDEAVRLYIDDCLKGSEGPRAREFNMRWIASLVAEAYRILIRGGVFLYPADARKGYSRGRLRLVYEANPIAMLIEQAGGAATDTVGRVLDLTPTDLHQRVPLVFGATKEVEHIARFHAEPSMIGDRAPLFAHRSLFRL